MGRRLDLRPRLHRLHQPPALAQTVLFVSPADKYTLLKWLLATQRPARALIFPRMRHHTALLAQRLSRDGFPAAPLHADLPQAQRNATLQAFRRGTPPILVATDLAARGLDIPGITHVINYDPPDDPQTYIHRIGRTARAGAPGTAITLIAPHDRQTLRNLDRRLPAPIPQNRSHPFHSEAARLAMGAQAMRKPRKQ